MLAGGGDAVFFVGRITKPTRPIAVTNTAAIAAPRRIRDRLRRLAIPADGARTATWVSRSAIGAATVVPVSVR